ncbi:TraB/GumN family protein [Jiulongibacter sediminis]|jgi:uncharacterized protein YbaP (TraB family)|uniref:TraB/GumN family protein n=1 Tax=Jiulongibacter sediminis TaxID=1605367 RepID=UPI0026EB1954|nr:TraB/GumN family protein [Jiulongibacter sediminis]
MKRIIFLLLFSSSLFAQQSTLFELSKPGLSHKSYLFGTIHMTNDKVFNFNDSVYVAINGSEKAFFEIDMNDGSLSKDALKSTAMEILPTLDSSRIKSFFVDDLFPGIEKQITPQQMADRINNDLLPMLEKALPMFMEQKGERTLMMDQYLTQYALASGKEIVGIENVNEQMDALLGGIKVSDDFFTKKTAKKIISFLKNGDIEKPVMDYLEGQAGVIDTYHDFALSNIEEMLRESMNSKIYDRLIIQRNDIMFERTLPEVISAPVFIAVGTGHLVGANGLLKQFRDAGFKIREVDVKSDFTLPQNWKSFENDKISLRIPTSLKDFYYESDDYDASLEGGQIFTPKGVLNLSITHYGPIEEEIYEEEPEPPTMEIPESKEGDGFKLSPPPMTKEDGEPSYLGQVIQKVDFMEFLGKAMSQIKPMDGMQNEAGTLIYQGEEIDYTDSNMFGKRTIGLSLQNGDDQYEIRLTGDSGAMDVFDWKSMITALELK